MIQLIDDIPVTEQNLGVYSGWIRADLPKLKDPHLDWRGAKLSTELWTQLKSFMRWTQEEFQSEAQTWLYYHKEKELWLAAIPPQTIRTGMRSSVLTHHDTFENALKWVDIADGWQEAGTLHHHCSATAFMSGTDEADEKKKIGLHITLGSLNCREYDIDCRASLRGVIYSCDLSQWLEPAEDDNFLQEVDTDLFPETWKDYLHEPPPIPRWMTGVNKTHAGYHSYPYDQFSQLPVHYQKIDVNTSKPDAYEGYSEVDMWPTEDISNEQGELLPLDKVDLSNEFVIIDSKLLNDEWILEGIELASFLEHMGINFWQDELEWVEKLLDATTEMLSCLYPMYAEGWANSDLPGTWLKEAHDRFGEETMPNVLSLTDLDEALLNSRVRRRNDVLSDLHVEDDIPF